MWLDRLSGHSTPSASPPPQKRSFSPAPRRPSHLAPGTSSRPGFSPRSSSLNVAQSNSSTTSLNSSRLPNGSGLKQQVSPSVNVADPLEALEEIVGKLPKTTAPENADGGVVGRPADIVEIIDFNGLGLDEFVQADSDGLEDDSVKSSVEECEYVRSSRKARVSILNFVR